jgi:hypothetical protein
MLNVKLKRASGRRKGRPSACRLESEVSMSPARRWILAALFFAAGLGAGLVVFRPPPPAPIQGGAPSSSTSSPPAWDAALGAPPRFVDAIAGSGIDFRHENGITGKCQYLEIMGAGVGIFDYDGDGLLDLYFVNGQKLQGPPDPAITNRLYRNEGAWKFRDVTAAAGVGDAGYGQGCCAGDYDNDGDSDLYVSNYGPNVLYRNNGDGTFSDATADAGVADAGWGQTSSFLDYDRDGWLDLYLQNYLRSKPPDDFEAFIYIGGRKVLDYPSPLGFPGAQSRLLRNQRNGTFRDVTQEAGLIKPDGKGMGVACADLNDDGFTDIFVANDTAEDYLFLNRGDGRFDDAGLAAGVAFNAAGVPTASMGVDAGDVDGDGLPDLIVPCLRQQFFTLFRNRGGYFEDATAASGLSRATASATGFSANFIDYDNDGDLDLFFANGGVRRNEGAPPDASYRDSYGMRALLLANDGKGRFTDVSERAGPYFQALRIGRGSAVGDLDNDGDLDLVVSHLADGPALLRNDTPGAGRWLSLSLRGRGGRRDPLGARVRLAAGGRSWRAELHGRVAYLSQSDRRLHFGLGAAAAVDRIEIRWPDGETQALERLEPGREIAIEQGR